VLAWPVIAWSEAVTIEQEKERSTTVTDVPDPVGPPDRMSVLVHVYKGVNRGPIRAFAKDKGGIVKHEYKTVLPNVMNLRNIPVTAFEALKRLPGVKKVEEDKYHPDLIKIHRSTSLIRGLQSQINNARMQYSREMISPQKRSTYNNPGMGMPSMFDQMFTQPFSGMMPGNTGGTPWLDRQADLHDYGNRLTQAQNQHVSARSQLDEIDAKLRDARSFAPFKGVIVRKMVEVGDTVNPGQELLEFADLTYLQLKVDIPSRLMPGLKKGMMVPARLDVGNNQINARVAQIFPTADAQRHTVTVKFDLPDDVQGGPGMYAEVMIPDITMPKSDIPTIPDSAVLWRGSLPAVFVVGSDNKPKLRLVRLGDYVNANQVSVLSGLKIGESIYAVPPANIAHGWASSSQEK
jgi:hypothetical protein